MALGLCCASEPSPDVRAAQPAGEGGQLGFTNITAASGLDTVVTGGHGVFWADVTGDGRPDLFMTSNECYSGTRRNRFYRNLGGTFVEEAGRIGLTAITGGSHGVGKNGHVDVECADERRGANGLRGGGGVASRGDRSGRVRVIGHQPDGDRGARAVLCPRARHDRMRAGAGVERGGDRGAVTHVAFRRLAEANASPHQTRGGGGASARGTHHAARG